LQKQTDSQSRAAAISEFLATLDKYAMKGDFLKFKWVLPTRLSEVLTPSERALLDGRLGQLRHKAAKKLFDVYPHCSDEFSLDPAFIDAAFDASPMPLFDRGTPIFTMGSCFARNIATYLKRNDFNADTFGQVEDLNSPLSNALMLAVVASPAERRLAYLQWWLGKLFAGQPEELIQATAKKELARLEALQAQIADAKVLTLTLGNTVDFFIAPAAIVACRG
jgi:hypothetical protein